MKHEVCIAKVLGTDKLHTETCELLDDGYEIIAVTEHGSNEAHFGFFTIIASRPKINKKP